MVISYTNFGILWTRENHPFVVFFKEILDFSLQYIKSLIFNH